MFTDVEMVMIKAITPIHAGMGRTIGLIDMPIQREKQTGIPKIEGSTIKGCMRKLCRLGNNKEKHNIESLFGPENGNDNASILSFSDAKLLFYPIITTDGIFAYVTCPYLLDRYHRDISMISKEQCEFRTCPKIDEGKCISLKKDGNNSIKNAEEEGKMVILDEYSFKNLNIDKDMQYNIENIDKCELHDDKKIVIICDNDFMELLTLCRDVITRNRIDESTGVVKKGGLFTEEYLPTESVLYTLILRNGVIADDTKGYDKYLDNLPDYAQIGGNVTIGKGIVKLNKLGLLKSGGESDE